MRLKKRNRLDWKPAVKVFCVFFLVIGVSLMFAAKGARNPQSCLILGSSFTLAGGIPIWLIKRYTRKVAPGLDQRNTKIAWRTISRIFLICVGYFLLSLPVLFGLAGAILIVIAFDVGDLIIGLFSVPLLLLSAGGFYWLLRQRELP